jgi:hypothetical protein
MSKKIGTIDSYKKNWNRYIHNWFGNFAKAQGINYKILKFTILAAVQDWNSTNKNTQSKFH